MANNLVKLVTLKADTVAEGGHPGFHRSFGKKLPHFMNHKIIFDPP